MRGLLAATSTTVVLVRCSLQISHFTHHSSSVVCSELQWRGCERHKSLVSLSRVSLSHLPLSIVQRVA